MGLITTIASLTTTSSITSVLIIVMLELSAPHVSNVFGCLAPIYRFSLLNTVGLVLAAMDIVIILKFLQFILTVELYILSCL